MNQKGFTLSEILFGVLIIGILAAIALPSYFKVIERARIAEAVTILGSTSQSQSRRWMRHNSYTQLFSGLDVSPTNDAKSLFCTKGPANQDDKENCNNGFAIELDGTGANKYGTGHATATRVGNDQYQYILKRYYQSPYITCTATTDLDKALCADFCGLDSVETSCCNNKTDGECTDFPDEDFQGGSST